jgi:RNA polymerase sigma factor (sigma-70 family)
MSKSRRARPPKGSPILAIPQSRNDADRHIPHAASTDRKRMTAEEEAGLARAWHAEGDRGARDRLVTSNLGLVVCIAQRYRNAGVPLEELIAEGNVGLMSAVDGFDPDCGSRFSTYAAYWIRQGIGRAFAANSPRGRLNGRDRRDLSELERASRIHHTRTGESPTGAELAQTLTWTNARVAACRSMHLSHARPCSLDQPRPDGSPGALQSFDAATPGREDRSAAGATVARLLQELSPFERAAVELRFGLHGTEPRSVDTIAHSLDHTRGEIRTALRTAMAKLSRGGEKPGAGHAGRPRIPVPRPR